ncbi:MAG: efflux RND transporter permease subunit [Reyranella sp.]|nr:efflux RND transporter permease subunit [Reyranella sp.]
MGDHGRRWVVLRHDALLRWGFNPLDVPNADRTAYQGETVEQVYEGVRIFNVAVRLGAELRSRPEEAGALQLRSPSGTFVPLDELATVRFASGRNGVLHEGGRRAQIVTANTSMADLGAVSAKVRNAIASLRLPAGISVSYTRRPKADLTILGPRLSRASRVALAPPSIADRPPGALGRRAPQPDPDHGAQPALPACARQYPDRPYAGGEAREATIDACDHPFASDQIAILLDAQAADHWRPFLFLRGNSDRCTPARSSAESGATPRRAAKSSNAVRPAA